MVLRMANSGSAHRTNEFIAPDTEIETVVCPGVVRAGRGKVDREPPAGAERGARRRGIAKGAADRGSTNAGRGRVQLRRAAACPTSTAPGSTGSRDSLLNLERLRHIFSRQESSFPAWWAVMVQLPAAVIDTVVPSTVQPPVVVKFTGRPSWPTR